MDFYPGIKDGVIMDCEEGNGVKYDVRRHGSSYRYSLQELADVLDTALKSENGVDIQHEHRRNTTPFKINPYDVTLRGNKGLCDLIPGQNGSREPHKQLTTSAVDIFDRAKQGGNRRYVRANTPLEQDFYTRIVDATCEWAAKKGCDVHLYVNGQLFDVNMTYETPRLEG